MKTLLYWCCLFSLLAALACGQSGDFTYGSVTAAPFEKNAPSYEFHKSDGSSKSPIVITRTNSGFLTPSDKPFRDSLHQFWIKYQFKDRYHITEVQKVQIEYSIPGQKQLAERFTLIDPKTNRSIYVHFYIGNWP